MGYCRFDRHKVYNYHLIFKILSAKKSVAYLKNRFPGTVKNFFIFRRKIRGKSEEKNTQHFIPAFKSLAKFVQIKIAKRVKSLCKYSFTWYKLRFSLYDSNRCLKRFINKKTKLKPHYKSRRFFKVDSFKIFMGWFYNI